MKAVEKFIEYLEVNWSQEIWEGVYKQKGQFFIEMEKELANQRVIEELENTIEMVGCMFSGSIVDELKKGIQSRIKELKQD